MLEKDMRKAWERLCKPMEAEPWPKAEDMRRELGLEFPWLLDAIDGLLADLQLQEAVSGAGIRLLPSVLVGPPGCGKSRLLHKLRRMHGGMVVNCAGMSDNRMLAGTARGWASQYPCAASVAAAQAKRLNPILGLDEIDKVSPTNGRNGDPYQTLLTQLEPTTARAWLDEGLGLQVDMSKVSWIATANDWDRIPPLLRTRLRHVECGMPRPEDFGALWTGCLLDLAQELGVDSWALPAVDPAARAAAEEGYRRGSLSARSLARVVRAAVQAAGHGERAAPRH